MVSRVDAPLSTAFHRLPVGAVTPRGWLATQLRLQADGLTGALEDIWPDVGPDSAWRGGNGEDWERGPYYLDGLVPLAHVLRDEALVAKAQRWVDAILDSQREDGWFGPKTNDDWWPRMVVLKVLTQHAEATGDDRVVPFLQRYFRYQLRELPARPLRGWGKWRGAENSLAVAWLYARTREPWLLDLARLLEDQTIDWDAYFTEFPHRDVTTNPRLSTHVVNVAMGVKGPAVRQLFTPSAGHRRALDEGLANLDRYHGQVHGMFSGDEHLAGPAAARGVELCAVVEMLFSLGEVVRVWGDPEHADRLERVAYNLLPASMTADVRAHQYHQQANQVRADVAPRDWTAADDDCTIFGLQPNYGCCTANMHQGWPKLVQTMWMVTERGGLVALVHGPSAVRMPVDSGAFAVESETAYPFGETIRYRVTEAPGRPVALHLRVPAWCDAPELSVNGERPDGTPAGGFLVVERQWAAGDEVELYLPTRPRLNRRANGAIGVDLGALVMVYAPGEIWERIPDSEGFGDWEVRPRSGWNVGIAVDEDILAGARVERSEPGPLPFGLTTGPPERKVEGAPVRLWVPGTRVAEWGLRHNSAAEPPVLADRTAYVGHRVQLVPYGCARVRVAEFPRLAPATREDWDS